MPSSLRVGVAYLPPPDTPGGRIYVEEGFEADLAQALGQALGVAVEIVLVPPSERAQALAQRRVDAVIGRIAGDDPLHQSAQVLASGYQSGLSPVVRSDRPPGRWDDLAGKIVCVAQANAGAQRLAQRLGAEVRLVRAPAQALMLVRTGECGAAIHDRAVLDLLFTRLSWQKFSATLPPVEATTMVVAVAKDRDDLARRIARGLVRAGSAAEWQKRREKWAALVSFEVYRDQIVGDCH